MLEEETLRESESVASLCAKTQDFYSDKHELTQILLRISEEKFGGSVFEMFEFGLLYILEKLRKKSLDVLDI